VSDLLCFGEKVLQEFSNPRLETEMLIVEVLREDRLSLRTNPERAVSFLQRWKFQHFVSLRLRNIPLAYIRGWKEWSGFRIAVSPSVLIPRDETEILIERMKEQENSPTSILDMGTGSGCIALALAKQFPAARVTAVDISRAALSVAQKNFRTHRVSIETAYSDLLSAIPEGSSFDLIVANVPYVPTNFTISEEVQKEPEEALFAGEDGLDLIRKLAQQLREKKIQFQSLWLEFLPQQWEEVQQLFSENQVIPVRDAGGDIYFAHITPQEKSL
jgi:release factor glutamine methyltransferase